MSDAARRPAVTAIIVVLNGETFLGEAIESILAQTYVDWELLVVDDGSTDGTADIVRGYAERNSDRIRLLAHPGGANLGIAASRNEGIAQARGRHVAFLDADDVWLPEKLAEQVAILDADPELGLVYGRTLIWHSWERQGKHEDYYYPLGVEHDRRHEPPVLFEELMRNEAQTPTTCNAMIRAELFARLGGFDPDVRGMFEDLTFFAKALAMTPGYVSVRTWAKYRQHPESCTALSSVTGGDAMARILTLGRIGKALAPLRPSRRVRVALRRARLLAALDLARHWKGQLRHRLPIPL